MSLHDRALRDRAARNGEVSGQPPGGVGGGYGDPLDDGGALVASGLIMAITAAPTMTLWILLLATRLLNLGADVASTPASGHGPCLGRTGKPRQGHFVHGQTASRRLW